MIFHDSQQPRLTVAYSRYYSVDIDTLRQAWAFSLIEVESKSSIFATIIHVDRNDWNKIKQSNKIKRRNLIMLRLVPGSAAVRRRRRR